MGVCLLFVCFFEGEEGEEKEAAKFQWYYEIVTLVLQLFSLNQKRNMFQKKIEDRILFFFPRKISRIYRDIFKERSFPVFLI